MLAVAVLALGAALASALYVGRSTERPRARRISGPPQPQPPPAPNVVVPPIPSMPDIGTLTRGVLRGHPGREGILMGVRALEQNNQLDRALALLQKNRDPVMRLELFLLLRRHGRAREGRDELLAFVKERPSGEWPAPLLKAYAGTASDDQVLAATHGDAGELCEAWYYLGRLHAPDIPALARTQLEHAANRTCDDAAAARVELEKLE